MVQNMSKVSAPPFSFGEVIFIGFTGSLGSGCTYIAEGIKNTLKDGRYYRLSDVLRDILKRQGINNPSTEQLQEEGNNLRKKKGVSILAQLCMEKIWKDSQAKPCTPDTVILIDGIRNDGEIRCFRAFPHFYLISIHADENVRKKRLIEIDKRIKTDKEFLTADARDREEDFYYGQQVQKCNYLADIIINNNETHPKGSDIEISFFQTIDNNYIHVIKAIRKGEAVPDHPPTIDEILMTAAYCLSKRSSCEKRKVGAVIAHIMIPKTKGKKPKRKGDEIHFQVISSGYNEVPLGTDPCKLGLYEKCYRDYLKEKMIKEFNYCPSCGKKIPSYTQRDIKKLLSYECPKCHKSISKKFLSGSTSGKLLDMCRALHAEEIAIIGLSGVSKSTGGELSLYTTTFPCNLCANKIVAAGIKKVIYAEPYSMEESKKILEEARVDTVKFEGVKSTAYFRLFS
jgi:deoxycytidylate deaminase